MKPELFLSSDEIVRHNLTWVRTHLLGISQRKMATYLGINRGSIYAYESGHCCPNIFTLANLSDILGVSLDVLIKVPLDADLLGYFRIFQKTKRVKKVNNSNVVPATDSPLFQAYQQIEKLIHERKQLEKRTIRPNIDPSKEG